MNKKRFHFQSFVSFFLFFSSIIMVFTGLILYFTPPGRVAKWINWTFLGFSKEQLEAVHTISSFAFLIASIFHIFVYNWKIMWAYIKRKAIKGIRYKKELITSFLLSIFIFIGSYFLFQPFEAIMDFGETLKNSWETEKSAPIPHAEDLTIKEFSQKILGAKSSEVIDFLKSKGIKIKNENDTIREVSDLNKKTPADIYDIMKQKFKSKLENNIQEYEKKESESEHSTNMKRGYGRMLLKELIDSEKLNKDKIIKYFKSRNIKYDENITLREYADYLKITPFELYEELSKLK